ncbi:MAG: hypothetical protein ACXVK4_14900 [Acidimicrobiia bacterium]
MHGRPGLSLVPAATGMILGSGAGAHLTAKHGGRITVAAGTLFAAAGLTVQGGYLDGVSYWPTGVGLLLFGLGAGSQCLPPPTSSWRRFRRHAPGWAPR